jgi:signal transduction histidine kinase
MAVKFSALTSLNITRLRIWLLVFFIALMIPVALLVTRAYEELQWEAFYQQRIQAEELTSRIDQRLAELISNEEKRSYTDYAFLNITGSKQINFLQRSPLASFPVESDIPGLLGYFQVDADGQFTTPLLPDDPNADRYGISDEEYRQRLGLQLKLLDILDRNQLVKAEPQGPKRKRISEFSDETTPASDTEDDTSMTDGIASFSQPLTSEKATRPSASISAAKPEPQGHFEKPVALSPKISQQAFDELEATHSASPSKSGQKIQLGRIADLKLDKDYQSRAQRADKEQKKSLPTEQAISEARAKRQGEKKVRREVSQLPETRPSIQTATQNRLFTNEDVRIRIFESEIDAFESSMLDSGHFVLFRKVWRNGQRIIQGMLIEQEPFIKGMISSAFRDTALSSVSHMLVAWQGNVISRVDAAGKRRYLAQTDELSGTLLYQASLSKPLDELQLVYTISQLPVGPGATVINWIAGMLVMILIVGLYLMYRTGVRQLQLVQQQQDFVSAVSHELKTPLTSIRMYGEMLQENWASEEKKRNYYDLIVGESERLTRLINNVLQLARFSRNAVQTTMREITIQELLDITQSAITTPLKSAGFTLDIQCNNETGAHVVRADTDHFIQIMINLVDNAIKFSANAEHRVIELACMKTADGSLQISIRDHGPGIAKDQMKKIFTLFYRAENELTRETVGTGIGLSLVNQLMREMNGSIDVQNAGPGARFILVFPPA